MKLNTLLNKIFLGVFVLHMLFAVDASAKKVKFLTSTAVPAARGHVIINHDKNRNYVISIHLFNLAEVERLEPTKRYYIVWMVTDEETTMNMGKIDSSTGFLSKKLKASFKTATSSKPSNIYITAEDDPDRQYPETQMILSTGNFNM
ncbi:MAG TPA: hypothetical protein DCR40_19490 [Prolixibacteraceae bacterium]|nr:hypothetical protein [Prolixibacteraceae bacterium]